MKLVYRMGIIILLSLFVLGGCQNQSVEEVVREAKEMAMMVFQDEEEITPNTEVNDVSIYIPNSLTIRNGDENNIILEDGDQTFIVFYNQIEGKTSTLNYEAAQTNNAILLEALEDNEKFGYIRILPEGKNEGYEVQIGVGGVKITTYSSKRGMVEDIEDMMKIAKGLALND